MAEAEPVDDAARVPRTPFLLVHTYGALLAPARSFKHFAGSMSGVRLLFTVAVLLLATVTRTASDCALGLLAGGLVAVASASRRIDTWEKLWQVAWITLPWAYALETAFMSNEALSAWRKQYTALRWLAACAAGLMGVVHGRLLSIPWKTRLATGTAVTCEMWTIFYVRGVATVVGVPVCTAFSLCLAICLSIYQNQQGLAQVSADALITHGYKYKSVDGSSVCSQPNTPHCQPADSGSTPVRRGAPLPASSGPYSKAPSLWSGWSAAWSDPGVTYQQKLSDILLSHSLPFAQSSYAQIQESVRKAKAVLAGREASKAKRRAEEHGKARGRLVWRLLLHGEQSPLARLPKDALRIIINEWAAAETVRLERLYAHRLAAGATSYRG